MRIVSIAVSKKKGTPKTPVEEAFLSKDHGLEGDAHAGPWHRQVSLLASESIEQAKAQGLDEGDGTNVSGPAPKGLAWYHLEIAPDDGQLVVDLAQPVARSFRLSVA